MNLSGRKIPMMTWLVRGAGALLLAVTIGACSHPAASVPSPPQVEVVTASATDIPVTRNYPGRLAATLTAQVRARVTGIVLKRVYKEGSDVKEGDVLFRIDPAPLQATLRAAQGQLKQAEAAAFDTKLKATRNQKIGAMGLLAKQDVDDAVAAAAQAVAAVESASANVVNARISLGYATVTAPISGRAGVANITQGALVSPTDTNPLATVQVINPIYANFSEPMAEMESLRKAEKSGGLKLIAPDKAQVQIVLPDGSVYGNTGSLDFTDLAVDPTTGAVDLRALIPNPDHTLLPGMFVTIRLTLATLHNAFLLPQSAIQRGNQGAYVYVVGTDNKLMQNPVDLGDQQGANWIVQGGITSGAKVVVSGTQNAQPGEKVEPLSYPVAANAASAGLSAR
jgi:membrane fusion protein (multidrug efflux system)